MKLYTICTPSHLRLLNDWFLPSLKDNVSVNIRYLNINGTGHYRTDEWYRIILEKTVLIIEAINENLGGKFIFSDVDVQFFSEINKHLEGLIGKLDIICQAESPARNYCTGFFVCRASHTTLQFWKEILSMIEKNKHQHDQDIFNLLVNKPKYKHMLTGTLPLQYMGGGTVTGNRWQPGDNIPVPKGIIMHHANFTKGVANKIAQLLYVKEKVDNYNVLPRKDILSIMELNNNIYKNQ